MGALTEMRGGITTCLVVRPVPLARGPAALATILVTCCGCERGPLSLTWPDRAGALARVLAVEGDGDIALTASGADEAPLTLGPFSARSLVVSVLFYDRPISELELDPGPIALASAGVRSRKLPRPDRVFEAEIEAGDSDGFVEIEAAASRYLELPVAERAGGDKECARFLPRSVSLPGPPEEQPDVDTAVALGPERALLLTWEGAVWRADAAGAVNEVVSSTAAISALMKTTDGTVWFGDSGGRFGHLVELDGGAGRVVARWLPGPGLGSEIADLVAPPDPGAVTELLAMTADGGVFRIRPRGSEAPLVEAIWRDEVDERPSRLAWLGPEEAALIDGGGQLFRLHAGSGMPDPMPIIASYVVRDVARLGDGKIAGVAYLASSDRSMFFVRSGPWPAEWTPLGDLPIAAYRIVPFGRGFLYSGNKGAVGAWQPGSGLCEPHTLGDQRMYALAVSGPDSLVAAGAPSIQHPESSTPVFFLSRAPR